MKTEFNPESFLESNITESEEPMYFESEQAPVDAEYEKKPNFSAVTQQMRTAQPKLSQLTNAGVPGIRKSVPNISSFQSLNNSSSVRRNSIQRPKNLSATIIPVQPSSSGMEITPTEMNSKRRKVNGEANGERRGQDDPIQSIKISEVKSIFTNGRDLSRIYHNESSSTGNESDTSNNNHSSRGTPIRKKKGVKLKLPRENGVGEPFTMLVEMDTCLDAIDTVQEYLEAGQKAAAEKLGIPVVAVRTLWRLRPQVDKIAMENNKISNGS